VVYRKPVLKFAITDTPTERRITASGKLTGPWIEELRRVWERCRSQLPVRKIVCDLNDVIHIEESAHSLLIEMMSEGTELVSHGAFNGWLIQALRDGKSHIRTRVIPYKSGIGYSVDLKQRLVTAVVEGTVSAADVREHLSIEERDSALPFRELIDARHAWIDLSPADVREIVDLLRSLSRQHYLGPTAVVVSSPVAFGVMRMLETLLEDVCVVHPFRDFSEAENWLRDVCI
jgi:ABC-type transporter Mla MlaB component